MSKDNSVAPVEADNTSKDPREVLEKLRETSPTFRECRPVALRIDKSIAERFPQFSRKLIRTAMRMHTASTRYLKSVEKGETRFDLDGNEAGEVTEEHREHAAEKLKARFAEQARRKREQRKEAEAEQRKAEKLQQLAEKFSKNG